MSQILSIRLDEATKLKLEALARQSRRSKSFLAAEAIAAYVEAEDWQLGETQVAVEEMDRGETVSHQDVKKWLQSWGKKTERKAPRK